MAHPDGMTETLTLAHLSDVHLPPPRAYRGDLRIKRLLGMANWYARRHRLHVAASVSAIAADVAAQAPGHIAVTGDLVNLGLPFEHAAAARWLGNLGSPAHVTAIPGNHDLYVPMPDERGIGNRAAFLCRGRTTEGRPAFPILPRRGRVAPIGLNSALPVPLFNAWGRVGPEQLRRLGQILADLGEQQLVRVVLIHHPPLPGLTGPRRALGDADELAAVLARAGAELVLHGHNHRAMTNWAEGPVRPIPVIGVPSASSGGVHGRVPLAGYNLYRIPADPMAPIEMIARGLSDPGGHVTELRRLILTP